MDDILFPGAVRLCWSTALDNNEDDKHIMKHRKIIIPVALNALVVMTVLVWFKYGPKRRKAILPVEVKADTIQTHNLNP